MGFDCCVAVSAGDRNAVVAVLNEVQLSDAIGVDGGHRLAAPACRGDPLPSALESASARPKYSVELAAPAIDGADDRVDGDRLEPEVAFGNPSQGGHYISERQQRQRVFTFCRQARSDVREGSATTLARKCCGGVGLWKSGEHVRNVFTGSRVCTYGCARELANEFRKGAVGEALPASLFPAFPTQRTQGDGHYWSRGPIGSCGRRRSRVPRAGDATVRRQWPRWSEKLTASRRRAQSKASAVLVDVELPDGDMGSRSRVNSPRFRGTGGSRAPGSTMTSPSPRRLGGPAPARSFTEPTSSVPGAKLGGE
jgi:hypothetical protein